MLAGCLNVVSDDGELADGRPCILLVHDMARRDIASYCLTRYKNLPPVVFPFELTSLSLRSRAICGTNPSLLVFVSVDLPCVLC